MGASSWLKMLGRLAAVLLGGLLAYSQVAASLPEQPTTAQRIWMWVAAVSGGILGYLVATAGGYAIRSGQSIGAAIGQRRPTGRELERARLALLDVIRHGEEERLQGSLESEVHVQLHLAERPSAVDSPRRGLGQAGEADRPLEPGTGISDVYARADRQLVILGEPGAGKTMRLSELALHLVERARAAPQEPMPVVFHLSSWATRRLPLGEWMVEELYRQYHVAPRFGRAWVEERELVPLLDGLDEVALEHRDACVRAINQYLEQDGLLPIAVACRSREHDALQVRLKMWGAVVILPLVEADVDGYLERAGPELAGVREAVRADGVLRELMTTPLFLNIVVLAYHGRSSAEVSAAGSLDERRGRVLADYVDAMFASPRAASAPYGRAETVTRLGRLARSMREHEQSIFYLDWLQPDWLPSLGQQRLVTCLVLAAPALFGVAAGLAVAGFAAAVAIAHSTYLHWFTRLPGGGYVGRSFLLPDDLALVLAIGAVVGCLGGLGVGALLLGALPTPTEQLRWSWERFRAGLGTAVLTGVLFVAGGELPSLVTGNHVLPIVAGLAITVLLAFTSGLETRLNLAPSAQGEGIRTSRRNGLIAGGVSAVLAGVPFWVYWAWAGDPDLGLSQGLGIGLLAGTLVGLARGLQAYLYHVALIWLLERDGVLTPRYVAFLEYASRLIFLRRQGAGYEFIHRVLLEHFAGVQGESAALPAPGDHPGVEQRQVADSSIVG